MPQYKVSAEPVGADGKYVFVIDSPPSANIGSHTSMPIYDSGVRALVAGITYLESRGLGGVAWDAVIRAATKE